MGKKSQHQEKIEVRIQQIEQRQMNIKVEFDRNQVILNELYALIKEDEEPDTNNN